MPFMVVRQQADGFYFVLRRFSNMPYCSRFSEGDLELPIKKILRTNEHETGSLGFSWYL